MNTLVKSPFRLGRTDWPLGPRWAPFREMERSMERMQRQLDNLFEAPVGDGQGKESMAIAEWSPSVDVTEDDKEYRIDAELPEVRKEDVKVSVKNGVLTLSGERKFEKEEKDKKYHRIERAYGSFERSFTLPDDVDPTRVSADFKDGMLKVHVPKNPAAKPKAVEIKVS